MFLPDPRTSPPTPHPRIPSGRALMRTTATTSGLKHDNTFGTPEEDAFRRDFTINALFYDIATFSIIDYVGGLQDLREGVVRSIGDPRERFQEDPVRMMRAIVMASRLGFRLDQPVVDGIARLRSLMTTAAPARLIEEYYKVLRSGAAEPTFSTLAEHRLLEPVTPELQRSAQNPTFRDALASLDAYRGKYDVAPASLTNAILLGTLLVPLGLMPRRDQSSRWSIDDGEAAEDNGRLKRRRPPKEPILKIGSLPIARRDTERLRQVLAFQRRLSDLEMSPRAKRSLLGRSSFHDALTWIEIHGNSPGVLEHWRGFIEALGPEAFERRAVGADGRSAGDTETGNGTAAPRAKAPGRTPSFQPSPRPMSLPSCPSCFFFVPFVSAVSPLELPHEGDQRVHAFLGERVVDRRAHAADRAVALEPVETGCG